MQFKSSVATGTSHEFGSSTGIRSQAGAAVSLRRSERHHDLTVLTRTIALTRTIVAPTPGVRTVVSGRWSQDGGSMPIRYATSEEAAAAPSAMANVI